ncbi:MAG TPA: hypothetical protein VHL58_12825 [Thermoanaerobaculia bacterium]|nr:hypothetical protein [Thermoanaerobaculia bacterium]
MSRPSFEVRLFEFAVGFILLFFAASRAHAQQPPRIGSITIATGDIYSPEEAKRGFLYRLADNLHSETKPSVVREFLLFKEGDTYDPARLRETERNLRALHFIRSAKISVGEPHDGVVDILVETADSWTFEPGTSVGNSGGVSTYGFELTDGNVGGTGRAASMSYDRGSDRARMAFDLSDPAFLRPYWRARATYAKNSDGFEHRLSLGKPFVSITSRSSGELSFSDYRRHDMLYRGGELFSTLTHDHRQFVASWALASKTKSDSATRWGIGTRILDDRLRSTTTVADSTDRSFRYLFLKVSHVQSRFLTWNFVDDDIRHQDFNLGTEFSMEAGVSPKALGVARTTQYVRAAMSRGWTLGGQTFVVTRGSFDSRIDQGLRNTIASLNGQFVHRWQTAIPQTFVAHLLLNNGSNLDPEVQFFADDRSGLRGYRLHAYEGSRNLVVNAEQRIFLGRELLQLISPGVVAFFDAGKASGGPLRGTSGFGADVGVGIRLGLPRTERGLIRIDAAYPLQRDPLGRRGLLISFSSGQAF